MKFVLTRADALKQYAEYDGTYVINEFKTKWSPNEERMKYQTNLLPRDLKRRFFSVLRDSELGGLTVCLY